MKPDVKQNEELQLTLKEGWSRIRTTLLLSAVAIGILLLLFSWLITAIPQSV